MNHSKEIIFSGGQTNKKILRFEVDGSNRLCWQVLPAGEKGETRPLSPAEAEYFMERHARMLGFTGIGAKKWTFG